MVVERKHRRKRNYHHEGCEDDMGYAKLFFEKFQKLTNENGSDKRFREIYKISDEYTYKMNNLSDGIIREAIRSIDKKMKLQNEYLRVDVTAWKSMFDEYHDPNEKDLLKKKFKVCGMTPHLWNLYFAVEHENDPKDWMDEVLKLAHLRCPLKVVIGYVPWNKRNDAAQGDKGRLALAAECLEWTKAYKRQPNTYFDSSSNETACTEEFLVILGNCSNGSKADYELPNYKGYLFDKKKGFQDIRFLDC